MRDKIRVRRNTATVGWTATVPGYGFGGVQQREFPDGTAALTWLNTSSRLNTAGAYTETVRTPRSWDADSNIPPTIR